MIWDDDDLVDLSGCPYYRGVGSCTFNCREEPSCMTDRPRGGWPSEQATESEAYATSVYDPVEGWLDAS